MAMVVVIVIVIVIVVVIVVVIGTVIDKREWSQHQLDEVVSCILCLRARPEA